MNFKQWYEKNEGSIYNDPVGAMEQAFKAGQQQYKALVKTVDADNLPKSGVFIITKQKTIKFGAFDIRGLFFDENFNKHKPTHYIEQKDLIELIALGEEK